MWPRGEAAKAAVLFDKEIGVKKANGCGAVVLGKSGVGRFCMLLRTWGRCRLGGFGGSL